MWSSGSLQRSSRIVAIALGILISITVLVWYAVWREDRRGILSVSFLDIGQGDAIFIDAPSGRQVLIDGGPDSTVLKRLSSVMPFYDRSIDVVIPTHPDSDHISGLIDVLQRYRVSYVMQSSVRGSTAVWTKLESEIERAKKEGAHVLVADRGEVIDLGKGAYLEILSPDRSVPGVETNTGCVVVHLVYGNTSFMLACDAPQNIERYLVSLDGASLKSDVLKAGHHGSRTSSSPLFVGLVNPAFAVFSRGCHNKYGHPHIETVATFAEFGIPVEDTCTRGTITFFSDGTHVSLK